MNSILIFSTVILFILGIIIIIFCLLSFIFPYGKQLRGRIQRIKAFGVDLEISVITLFVLIGTVMALSVIYLKMKGYETKLSEAENELKIRDRELMADYQMRVRLPNADKTIMQSRQWDGTFTLDDGTTREIQTIITDTDNRLRITFSRIPKDARVTRMELTEKTTQKSWFKEHIRPSLPEIDVMVKE